MIENEGLPEKKKKPSKKKKKPSTPAVLKD
jgi:hypothetical protein